MAQGVFSNARGLGCIGLRAIRVGAQKRLIRFRLRDGSVRSLLGTGSGVEGLDLRMIETQKPESCKAAAKEEKVCSCHLTRIPKAKQCA